MRHVWTGQDVIDYADMAIQLFRAEIGKPGEHTAERTHVLAQLKSCIDSAELGCHCSVCEKKKANGEG